VVVVGENIDTYICIYRDIDGMLSPPYMNIVIIAMGGMCVGWMSRG